MKAIGGHRLITPDDPTWKASPMQVSNADFLVRTGSENLEAGSEAGRLILIREGGSAAIKDPGTVGPTEDRRTQWAQG